jgi:hypothetical protein
MSDDEENRRKGIKVGFVKAPRVSPILYAVNARYHIPPHVVEKDQNV